LGPVFPHVAAGQAQGVVSERQARLIEKTVDELPDQVAAVHGAQVEKDLVDYAASFGPKQLGVIAQRIVAHLNPDGTLTDPDAVQRRRGLWLIRHRDGSSRIEGHLSEECTERLLTFFDTAAAPRPAVDGVKDPRRPEQRAHDALLDLLEAAVRGGMVPSNNGVSATIVVTMTAEQYASGDGLARTGHGASVPVRTIKGWSGGDAEVLAVVLNSVKAISHYSNVHRIFTEQQRRAIAARDRGCTFPGCPEPPGRCQVDHIPRWEDTHVTCVDGGALKCRYHHREQERLGYRPVMLGGVPYWIPPVWIDPAQTPVRNTLFDDIPAA
ncbi:DUF222 domain-containing protein, partial [uncultured Jatrophihabitans sp.]|uniref:HNH endonuclease signature motif containing protein n=1 Tax=uncultured Jatrophihabitans sp. TaxID=1610747 RepID=UPI0035CAC5CC